MAVGEGYPLVRALRLAQRCVAILTPACQRIEIAGSVRREKHTVNDIELVAIPKMVLPAATLFTMGMDTELVSALDNFDYSAIGKQVKGGSRYKQVKLHEGIALDIFICMPPAQWGYIFTLRTGNANFSHKIVTNKQLGGWMPSNMHAVNGALYRITMDGDVLVPTPEETDFFSAIGKAWIAPKDRSI